MESKGTLKDVSMDWKTGRMRLTFELESDVSSSIDKMKDKPLRIMQSMAGEAEPGRECVLLGASLTSGRGGGHIQAAGAQSHASEVRSESHDCRSDGVFGCAGHDRKRKETALEAETFHIRPTSQVKQGKDGKAYRTYTVLAGSSTYDTKEMSELINGLVAECKEQGIETLPPEELARMMAEYEENHRKKETVQRTDG